MGRRYRHVYRSPPCPLSVPLDTSAPGAEPPVVLVQLYGPSQSALQKAMQAAAVGACCGRARSSCNALLQHYPHPASPLQYVLVEAALLGVRVGAQPEGVAPAVVGGDEYRNVDDWTGGGGRAALRAIRHQEATFAWHAGAG